MTLTNQIRLYKVREWGAIMSAETVVYQSLWHASVAMKHFKKKKREKENIRKPI